MPLDEAREFYASYMYAASGSKDPRIKDAFLNIYRENFLPPGPWHIAGGAGGKSFTVETPSSNPIHLYKDFLVVLDPDQGINNGQPSLHANWIGSISPEPEEDVIHIGTGMGYYTAILSTLVKPGGTVTGYEVDKRLADAAGTNLSYDPDVTIHHENALEASLPKADIIYVNAGVAIPPVKWLKTLKPEGRLAFPWRPAETVGLGLMISNTDKGYTVKILGPNYFIPCVGCDISHNPQLLPGPISARKIRSLWLSSEKQPDETAIAIYDDIWFSSQKLK